MSFIELRKVGLADLDELVKLSRETFFKAFYDQNRAEDMETYAAQSFTRQKLEAEINTNGSTFYFAQLNGETVGFIKLNIQEAQNEYKDQNSLEVERLYVLAKHQGKRFGEQMLTFAFEVAHQNQHDFVWLGVWEHNRNAIRFYERIGFEYCGKHDFMLGNDKQTDILLRKNLK
ncbi:GNAT family N-acetyltransferase [Mucilaginibacter lacusdianchii]|uniref:GNAT family N-acetyltransferase n=1 Tax=Mucilaginibacter lacusdianchii TaxID=2684211 RepID=UPI00131B577A|nr:GNAT family N-acetyltransferase [Mucilaginibacter sp. JXJ CY 39]